MKVAFFGTPDFAVAGLRSLIASHHKVVCVVSQPDRPVGRGRKLKPTPVAQVALDHNIALEQPERIGTLVFRQWLCETGAEVGVVAAYGKLLGPKLLGSLPHGFLNIHASCLPRWRGASPIQTAILEGDHLTGVSIMQMDTGLDTGAVLRCDEYPISSTDTGQSLHQALATLGGQAVIQVLDRLELGDAVAQRQDDEIATHAPLLSKKDADLDWTRPAEELARRVRGLYPWPGTRTLFRGEWLKIGPPVEAIENKEGTPGTVLSLSDAGLEVATGRGVLRIHQLQPPGKRMMDVADFLRGYDILVGDVLGGHQ